jgi:geranylgeranyl diphosphate synthase type I
VLASAIGPILATELDARRADVAIVDERLVPVVDRLIRFTLDGGKRLRPQFLWWGWRAAGGQEDGKPAASALRAAASLELIQASALVHDDIIDNSDTRRGQPSMHVTVGVSAAILLGDLALAWADDMFTAAARQLDAADEAFDAWRSMRTEVLAGQLLDLRAAAEPDDDPATQASDARRVNRFKTAAYTIERPLHLGAALAGASATTVAALRAYGTAVGQAFQLRDDLLGVFGDAAVTGKPAGGDLIEGKNTVLLATARQRLSPSLRVELDRGIGRDGGPVQVQRLAELVAGSGAPEIIEDEISALLDSGVAALDEPGLAPAAVDALRKLATAATRRVR